MNFPTLFYKAKIRIEPEDFIVRRFLVSLEITDRSVIDIFLVVIRVNSRLFYLCLLLY